MGDRQVISERYDDAGLRKGFRPAPAFSSLHPSGSVLVTGGPIRTRCHGFDLPEAAVKVGKIAVA